MRAYEYGRLLKRLTVNLLLRDMPVALPFYTDALGLRLLYSDQISPSSKGVITESVLGRSLRNAKGEVRIQGQLIRLG